jgi:hypothetical protein
MLADELDYVIGVDTHLDEHVLAVVASPSGVVIAQRLVRANTRGDASALLFACEAGNGARVWAIEGSGSYGAGLARYLVSRGETVLETSRVPQTERRLRGKDDSLDAVRTARAALASDTLAFLGAANGVRRCRSAYPTTSRSSWHVNRHVKVGKDAKRLGSADERHGRLSCAVDDEPRHIWPRIVAGEIEVVPLLAYDSMIEFCDEQAFFVNNGFKHPFPGRRRDRTAAIREWRSVDCIRDLSGSAVGNVGPSQQSRC